MKRLKSRDKRALPHSEVGRTTRHTLDENLEQMMSGSFDISFPSGAHGEQDSFSSNIGAGFDFGDNEDFGLGDIGDELVKELGEGWTSAPGHQKLIFFY
jgi:meiotic recombination protein REC8, fungi type